MTNRRLQRRNLLLPIMIGAIVLSATGLIAARIDYASDALVPSKVSIEGLQDRHARLVAFRSREGGVNEKHLAIVPADRPTSAQSLFSPSCERIATSTQYLLCLGRSDDVFRPYQVTLLSRGLKPVESIALPGLPSRARLSPDGKYFATTTFVAGDSYSSELFSTRTFIYTIEASGKSIGSVENVEEYDLIVNDDVYRFPDKNVWGVTFVAGQDRFFATVSLRNHRYLVDGSITEKRMIALRDNVECPSLSPNGLRLAYKKRVKDDPVTWRFHVLDLVSGKEWPLGETRSIDDQLAWLDDDNVLYAVPGANGSTAPDIWKAPVDGGRPELFIPNGDSPTLMERGPETDLIG